MSGAVHKNEAWGAYLSGVLVKCSGKSDTTDKKGRFKLKGIATENQTITFSKSGYESYQTSVVIVANKKANIGDRWLTEIKSLKGSVAGKLHKNSASEPVLSGVSVNCDGTIATTDDNGNFELDGVAAGDHSISFFKSGYEPFQTRVKIVANKIVHIGDRRLIEKTSTGSISGK
ncbi:MAG: carboxypeptidase-like regulatory domain-containing protein [Lentisphaerae bacterium]|nr:carboxypeptidase-like regulatory domain-containing protein [Lentisphaerota bacterium]